MKAERNADQRKKTIENAEEEQNNQTNPSDGRKRSQGQESAESRANEEALDSKPPRKGETSKDETQSHEDTD